MRILAIADEPSKVLWSERCRSALEGVELILAAGDLPASYLSYLTCFTSAPIVYVHGNHDERYGQEPPEGCLCAEDKVIYVNGVRILGLGGSRRYRPDGRHMYTEEEMLRRIRKLKMALRSTGGFDILLTHAPVLGLGDQEDLCHRGFACFGTLLDTYRPAVMIYGHIHQCYTAHFVRERTHTSGTPVINASTSFVFDLPETPGRREPTRRGIRLMNRASKY